MKRVVSSATAIGSLALGGVLAASVGSVAGGAEVVDLDRRVARGKDLIWSIGCNDCHTPKKLGPEGPVLDTARLLSGHREDAGCPSRQRSRKDPGAS